RKLYIKQSTKNEKIENIVENRRTLGQRNKFREKPRMDLVLPHSSLLPSLYPRIVDTIADQQTNLISRRQFVDIRSMKPLF
ncbi:hypothetical protein PMAYCL1PPCAC_27884, partial [Pristionchus mayeri]